jgi:hypothetical protein
MPRPEGRVPSSPPDDSQVGVVGCCVVGCCEGASRSLLVHPQSSSSAPSSLFGAFGPLPCSPCSFLARSYAFLFVCLRVRGPLAAKDPRLGLYVDPAPPVRHAELLLGFVSSFLFLLLASVVRERCSLGLPSLYELQAAAEISMWLELHFFAPLLVFVCASAAA